MHECNARLRMLCLIPEANWSSTNQRPDALLRHPSCEQPRNRLGRLSDPGD